MTADAATSSEPAGEPRERLLTLPLAAFLVAVVAVLGLALAQALRQPSAAEAIVLLGDGDLDGEERLPVLRRLLANGSQTGSAAERWAAAAAAVALEDRAGLQSLLGTGDVPNHMPGKDQREFLSLGDPFLANLVEAWLAEGDGDLDRAHTHWQRLSVQCRYVPNELAAGLAAAGLERTRRGR